MMQVQSRERGTDWGIMGRVVLWFVVLVILPFLLLAVIIAAVFSNYTISDMGENALYYVNHTGDQITDILKEYEEVSMDPYYNGYVESLAHLASMTGEERAQIQTYLTAACYSNSDIRAIYIVSGEDYLFGGKEYFTVFDIMEPHQAELAQAAGACRWYSTNQIFGTEQENRYILARSLNGENQQNIAYLYMVIDGTQIRDVYAGWNLSNTEQYLVDRDGKVLFSSVGGQINQTMDLSGMDENQLLISQYVKEGDRNCLQVVRHMMYVDWYCICQIPISQIRSSIIRMEFPFLIIAVIYGLFLFVMLRMLRRYVFHPLQTLNNAMDHYAQESLGAMQIEPVGVGEFRSLSQHFNRMTARIAGLMEDYRREEQEKNQQRMNALAAQLTPHFIYNALNTIKWMAVLNHQDNIRGLTESLIHIFMNAARADEGNYTLGDELDLIENYAVIQKARFMNFDLAIEVPQECRDCLIRKLLLQPIVENAIVHGFGRGRIKDGRIVVTARMDEDLYIEVADNGVGFDVERWREHPDTDARHTNIGIHNVEQIIALEYKAPYGLTIDSIPEQGTTIRYHLPVRRRKVQDDTDHHC